MSFKIFGINIATELDEAIGLGFIWDPCNEIAIFVGPLAIGIFW